MPEIELLPSDDERAFLYLIAYHAPGREKESDAALNEYIDKFHAISAYQIAQAYAFRNQPTKRLIGWTELMPNVTAV